MNSSFEYVSQILGRSVPNVYRVFFPLGLFFGLLGVSVWIPNLWQSTPNYPLPTHSRAMIDGFLFFFVFGFLGTAIPRMTNSFPVQIWEILFGLISAGIFGVSLILGSDSLALAASFFGYMGIFIVGIRRIFARTKNPPTPFIFIFATVLIAILTKFVTLLSLLGYKSWGEILPLMQSVYLHSTMTGFILGVGSFLVPVLLSVPVSPPLENDEASGVRQSIRKSNMLVMFCFGIYLLSVLLEAQSIRVAYSVRVVSIALIAFTRWKLHRWPRFSGVQGRGIFVACWMLLVGHAAVAAIPERSTHLIHIVYITSVSLMILMVATRVILAHGGHQRQIERKSIWIWLTIICFCIAAATRVFAPFIPSLFLSHLAYAAIFWILAIVFWSFGIYRQTNLTSHVIDG